MIDLDEKYDTYCIVEYTNEVYIFFIIETMERHQTQVWRVNGLTRNFNTLVVYLIDNCFLYENVNKKQVAHNEVILFLFSFATRNQ